MRGKEQGSRSDKGKKAIAVARLVDVVSRFVNDNYAGHYCTESYGDAMPTDEFEKFFEEMKQAVEPLIPKQGVGIMVCQLDSKGNPPKGWPPAEIDGRYLEPKYRRKMRALARKNIFIDPLQTVTILKYPKA